MPQPTSRDLHVDSLLSNLSIGYANEPSDYVAAKVFPVLRVDKQSDLIAKYNKGDWFRDEAKKRGRLTESAGGGFRLDDPITFFCHEYAFHQDLDEDDIANADSVYDLEDDATQFTTSKIDICRERIFGANYFKTGVWGQDLKGQTDTPGANEFKCWDLANSTPLEDITTAKKIIKKKTGLSSKQLTLIVAEGVHMKLKLHADIKDIFKYTQAAIITEQLLARALEVREYLIAGALYAPNKPGNAEQDTLEYALNQYGALLLYCAPTPSKRRPSGGYTIRWRRPRMNGIAGDRLEATVRRFELPLIGGRRIESSMYENMVLTGADCGVFFENAIADGRSITS